MLSCLQMHSVQSSLTVHSMQQSPPSKSQMRLLVSSLHFPFPFNQGWGHPSLAVVPVGATVDMVVVTTEKHIFKKWELIDFEITDLVDVFVLFHGISIQCNIDH